MAGRPKERNGRRQTQSPNGSGVQPSSQSVPSHRSARAPLQRRALQTKELLISNAKALFLARGYTATTVDDIVEVSKVSRASFYTYFSSKREIMIVAGHDSRHHGWELLEDFGRLNLRENHDELIEWLREYFDFLEAHGGYMLTWQQAALQDVELRTMGMRAQQKALRIFCASLRAQWATAPEPDLMVRALAIRSMLDRFWYHWWFTRTQFRQNQVFDNLASLMLSMIRAE
jgi:AcrR family transcriptional regulator